MSVGTSAENFAGVDDAHSRENVGCRKRPREARKCAKAHFLKRRAARKQEKRTGSILETGE